MENEDANAYTEILEIFKYIPQEDYNKIPKNKIEVFQTYANKDYHFKFNTNVDLDEQNVSKATKEIIALLFRDYWATEDQRNKIIRFQQQERIRIENEKKEKYKCEDIFVNKNTSKINNEVKTEKIENVQLTEYKETIFQKMLEFFRKIFKK